jgi:hypothetical protein
MDSVRSLYTYVTSELGKSCTHSQKSWDLCSESPTTRITQNRCTCPGCAGHSPSVKPAGLDTLDQFFTAFVHLRLPPPTTPPPLSPGHNNPQAGEDSRLRGPLSCVHSVTKVFLTPPAEDEGVCPMPTPLQAIHLLSCRLHPLPSKTSEI